MKTLHTTNTQNANHSHGHVRLMMTLAGIVIAILCSMDFLLEVHSTERLDASIPQLLETSRIVVADLLIEVKAWL